MKGKTMTRKEGNIAEGVFALINLVGWILLAIYFIAIGEWVFFVLFTLLLLPMGIAAWWFNL